MPKKRSKTKTARARAPGAGNVPTLKFVNYLGIDHEVVKKKINPNVEFKCYMSVSALKGSNRFVAAVYLDSKPDRELGHKDYMLIHSAVDPITMKSAYYISGRSTKELEKDRIHSATMCLECKQVLVSLSGHHFHSCGCTNDMFVDGGQCTYSRVGAMDLSKVQNVNVDMLTGEIKLLDKSRKRK